jgi:UDPglucose--hexose-1-phosphate uridylyltransferase
VTDEISGVADRPATHRRHDPLTDRWVTVSAGRTDRPWQGAEESPPAEHRPAFDPACYLCPGNTRSGGQTNPDYDTTFVFTNDFAALVPDPDPLVVPDGSGSGLLSAWAVAGTCRVLCFSPRHDLTMARMSVDEIHRIVRLWVDQLDDLTATYPWVQVFENRGEAMGASNPHPHGQLWALDDLPVEARVEDATQRAWLDEHGAPLLLDYARREAELGQRVVVGNDHWLVVVPWWATWPFEVLVLPRTHVPRLTDTREDQRRGLAEVLAELTVRYDNLFHHPFPYSMGWHQAPGAAGDDAHWQTHAHFYPPLLRSATVRKWMVGFEMLAEPGRDLTAEEAARRLLDVPATHYLDERGDGRTG